MLKTLKKRADFLRVQQNGQKINTKGVMVFSLEQQEGYIIRVGYTATKKLGGAVVRNRIKRRLRAVARDIIAAHAKPGYDYVLIGRHHTAARPFEGLKKDIIFALHQTNCYQ